LATNGAAGAKADHSRGVRIEDTPPLLVSWTEVWGIIHLDFIPIGPMSSGTSSDG
jgi:hypothetical protein